MVDAVDSKSIAERRAGSSPAWGTTGSINLSQEPAAPGGAEWANAPGSKSIAESVGSSSTARTGLIVSFMARDRRLLKSVLRVNWFTFCSYNFSLVVRASPVVDLRCGQLGPRQDFRLIQGACKGGRPCLEQVRTRVAINRAAYLTRLRVCIRVCRATARLRCTARGGVGATKEGHGERCLVGRAPSCWRWRAARRQDVSSACRRHRRASTATGGVQED